MYKLGPDKCAGMSNAQIWFAHFYAEAIQNNRQYMLEVELPRLGVLAGELERGITTPAQAQGWTHANVVELIGLITTGLLS